MSLVEIRANFVEGAKGGDVVDAFGKGDVV